jgi:hypothetical protein
MTNAQPPMNNAEIAHWTRVFAAYGSRVGLPREKRQQRKDPIR